MIRDFCELLKAKRRERGLSTKEVVEQTKLYPSVIAAIEAGECEKIDPTYLKGFVRIYASFLGVEMDASVEEFLNERKKEKDLKFTRREVKKKQPPLKFPPLNKKIIKPLLLLVAVLIAFSALSSAVRKISSLRRSKPKESPPLQAQESPRVPVKGEIFVSLKARKDCFIRASVDGNILFEGILSKGISESWQGKKEIELKISDGSVVDVEVNGERLRPLTKSPKTIKSLKITPHRISIVK